ncbi:MAG: hypothetical protein ABIO92_00030 [Chloroflexia bacterium]
MLKTILPPPLSSPTGSQPDATTQGRKRLSPGYMVRAAIAIAVIAVWGLLSVNSVVGSWLQGIQRQATLANSTDPTGVEHLSSSSFHALLQTARTTCPQDKPFFLLNNGSAINQLSDYYFYPRRVRSIEVDEPFGRADLDAHKGGCVATYGPQNATRIDLFKETLKEVICSEEGCLYLVQ